MTREVVSEGKITHVRKFAGEPLLFARPDFGPLIGRVFRVPKPRPGELGFETFPWRASLD